MHSQKRARAPSVSKPNRGAEVNTPAAKKRKAPNEPGEEKRLRRFRDKMPKSLELVRDRALCQRMFALERRRLGTADCPTEEVELAGATGNVYTIHIGQVLKCDCPHAQKGHHCKHLFYVMARVLHAPQHLQYQAALLSSELREIFERAPLILSLDPDKEDNGRKPIDGDDCPICCMELASDKEDIVYCRAACGNNLHKVCFDRWAASKRGSGSLVTCPFCRSPWQEDAVKIKSSASPTKNEDGYINLGAELGLPTERDVSTYHQYRSSWSRGFYHY